MLGPALSCARSSSPTAPVGQNPLARVVQVYGHGKGASLWPEAMGIDWMRREELAEAIPPAYTEWIGRQLIDVLEVAA